MKKALTHLKNSDVILASIIERVGPCRISYRDPTFEALARSIVFQQLSTKAARTIYGRLEEAAGGAVTPEAIRNLSVAEMRQAGLSKQKIGYIRDLAEHAVSGTLDFARLVAPGNVVGVDIDAGEVQRASDVANEAALMLVGGD